MNCYIHILPGRMRIRTDFLKKNDLGAFSLRSGIYSLRGMHSVVINTITGSILISFDVLQISSQDILATVAQYRAIPQIDYQQSQVNARQVIRMRIESRNPVRFDILPFILRRAAQAALSG